MNPLAVIILTAVVVYLTGAGILAVLWVAIPAMRRTAVAIPAGQGRVTLFLPGGATYARITPRRARRIARRNFRFVKAV
jgi:hypothetical protein